jgi:hypothetical protein
MTAADLDALERLLAEATPGRWRVDGSFDICRDPNGAPDDNGDIVCRGYDHADARLIVAMHSALPELIAAARERDGLRAHYDTAGPEHNLLALLDLYEKQRASATAERDALRAEIKRLRAVVEAATTLHRRDEWHEDDGNVIWWTLPIEEPPYVGTLLDEDIPDYVTHWTRLVVPAHAALDAAKECE